MQEGIAKFEAARNSSLSTVTFFGLGAEYDTFAFSLFSKSLILSADSCKYT